MIDITPAQLTAALKGRATELGFSLSGACPAVEPTGLARFQEWLAAGYGGEMRYLEDRAAAYAHPGHVLSGARSILMLGMHYRTAEPAECRPGEGRISRYAWGEDYHELVRDRLNQLVAFFKEIWPAALARGVIDTAPLMEREFAQLAGLGWIGKNTLLLNKQAGSWFFLAALITDLTLEYDLPHEASHCGTCTACLDACPTQAFVEPYVLDARRCISYLTIELKGPVTNELRAGVGDWLLGCDICQEVCPWNRRAPLSAEASFEPRADENPVDLIALFWLDDDAFRRRFRDTPLWRPKRRGILRNAATILGNHPTPGALAALLHGLRDGEPLVRDACAWALGRYPQIAAREGLERLLEIEEDEQVRSSATAALALHLQAASNIG